MKTIDERYMREALQFARKGSGNTFPNPMVGAVLVKNGKIIGKGYHKKAGMPHAEIEAFNAAIENPKGATLYVTLEPCCFLGRTGPCTDQIIKRGISKVICAVSDPNPKVGGKGIKILQEAGIDVSVGLLSKEAEILNEAFFTFQKKDRPFVAIKFGASLDGRIATKTGDSKWITNEKARRFARNLRSEYHAILVGINTVLHDNPNLGSQQKNRRDPLRIILDSTLKIPPESDVLRDKNVLIVTTKRADSKKLEELQKKEVDIMILKNEKIIISELLNELRKKEIVSVFIEGGAEVLGSFVDSKMVDRVYAFYAPLIIGGRDGISAIKGEGVKTVSEALHLKNTSYKKFDDNLLITGSC